jgi:hypothetical protein
MLPRSGQSDWKPILDDWPWEPLAARPKRARGSPLGHEATGPEIEFWATFPLAAGRFLLADWRWEPLARATSAGGLPLLLTNLVVRPSERGCDILLVAASPTRASGLGPGSPRRGVSSPWPGALQLSASRQQRGQMQCVICRPSAFSRL